ncbi:MAG: hypothetical protein H6737_29975 [Alphaproteobacteria bacterium]|nr:hypothetical protein [Alphaproteobacteria bacterium]
MHLELDKIASSTRNAGLSHSVVLTSEIPAERGVVLAVRVLDQKTSYNEVEDPHGRMMTIHAGDLLAGVLGGRKALRGYTGEVPTSVRVGDILHLLNKGGVIGLCSSYNPEVGPPARVEVLGAVLCVPDIGPSVPATIHEGPVKPADALPASLPPMILLAGTCMHAGKTAAACSLIRQATARGLRVGATKVTGVALRRDSLEMRDHGARVVCTFADAGLPSTCDVDPLPVARGCLQYVAERDVDLVVVELGDGLLGEYGVSELLAELGPVASGIVLSATDPVAAWGGIHLLRALNLEATVVTGPATDNAAGGLAIAHLNVPAANARTEAELLAAIVLDRIFPASPMLRVMP